MHKLLSLNPDSFEQNDQAQAYFEGLKSGMIPHRFAYVASAAHTHDELFRSIEYGMVDLELSLIRAGLSQVLTEFSSIGLNIVDVGSGNGMKASEVIRLLSQRFAHLNYAALDYSSELLEICKRRVCSNFPLMQVKSFQIDFEKNSFGQIVDTVAAISEYPCLLLFLGHSLGNSLDSRQTLLNIRDSMRSEDTLLIGVELYQPERIEEILGHYRNEPFYRAVFEPLTFVGLKRDDGSLEVSFNREARRVEVHFEFWQDVTVLGSTTETVEFQRGEKLLIFISYRFTKRELQETFSSVALEIRDTIIDDAGSYLLLYARTN